MVKTVANTNQLKVSSVYHFLRRFQENIAKVMTTMIDWKRIILNLPLLFPISLFGDGDTEAGTELVVERMALDPLMSTNINNII